MYVIFTGGKLGEAAAPAPPAEDAPPAPCGIDSSHVQELEAWIDHYTTHLPELTNFILPVR